MCAGLSQSNLGSTFESIEGNPECNLSSQPSWPPPASTTSAAPPRNPGPRRVPARRGASALSGDTLRMRSRSQLAALVPGLDDQAAPSDQHDHDVVVAAQHSSRRRSLRSWSFPRRLLICHDSHRPDASFWSVLSARTPAGCCRSRCSSARRSGSLEVALPTRVPRLLTLNYPRGSVPVCRPPRARELLCAFRPNGSRTSGR